MKIRLPLLMMLCALGLSACACPAASRYDGDAYDQEHMAGSGVIDEGCLKRAVF